MFRTIYTVTKIVCDSEEYNAYFEDLEEARRFAESEVAKSGKDYSFCKRNHTDGSFLCHWDSETAEFLLDDFAWISDWKFNGIGFFDNKGLFIGDFPDMESLRERFRKSQARTVEHFLSIDTLK